MSSFDWVQWLMELSTHTGCLEAARGVIFELAIRGALLDGGSLPCTTSSTEGTESPVHDTGALFAIPAHWSWTTLEQLGEVQPRNSAPNDAPCGFVPMASISARYGTPLIPELRRWCDVRKGYTHLADGDVILAKITPCFENGKSGLVSGLPSGIGAGTTELHVIRPQKDRVVPAFLAIVLKSPGFIRRGIPRMTGSAGQKRVPSSYFSTTPIPLPPLAEQKRIVAKVDELMALCDRLDSQLKQRDEQASVLAKAAVVRFQADPTVENLEYLFHPSFETAPEQLRTSILHLAVRRRLVAPAASTALQVELGEIVDIVNGRAYAKEELLLQGTPVLRVGNLFTSKQWYYSDLRLPTEKYCDEGDLLYAWSASFGPFIWKGPRCIFHYHIWKLIPKIRELNLRYLYWFLQEKTAEIKAAGHGVSMVHMTKAKMERISLELPGIDEQNQIVAKVDELMALVDQLESQITASEEAGAKLLDALVAELAPST